jgi:hypothetical protein
MVAAGNPDSYESNQPNDLTRHHESASRLGDPAIILLGQQIKQAPDNGRNAIDKE